MEYSICLFTCNIGTLKHVLRTIQAVLRLRSTHVKIVLLVTYLITLKVTLKIIFLISSCSIKSLVNNLDVNE